MQELWMAKDELLTKMDRVRAAYPELKSWIGNKQKEWVLAGLAREQSKIPIQWRTSARKHTGNCESSHLEDNNFTAWKISLLGAVLKSKRVELLKDKWKRRMC